MKIKNILTKISASLVVVSLFALSATPIAEAASLTALSDILTNATQSAVSNHTIQFTTPTGVAAGQTIILTFQSDFLASTTMDYTDMDVLVNSVQVTLGSAAVGAAWGAVRTSGTVITLTNGNVAVTAGSVIKILIGTNATNQSTGVRQIANPSSAGNYTVTITGTFTDTGSITVPILANDQVAVSATVAQTLTFSISTTTVGFGTLNTGAATYANSAGTGSASPVTAHNIIVGTNAASGYTLTVQGSTLTSGLNTIAAIGGTAAASSIGTPQFGLDLQASGGTGTVSSPYNSSTLFAYAATATTTSQVASATTASANTTYSAQYLANISSLTPAGSYSTALTYVATANF